jgi:hypothetical protein
MRSSVNSTSKAILLDEEKQPKAKLGVAKNTTLWTCHSISLNLDMTCLDKWVKIQNLNTTRQLPGNST